MEPILVCNHCFYRIKFEKIGGEWALMGHLDCGLDDNEDYWAYLRSWVRGKKSNGSV